MSIAALEGVCKSYGEQDGPQHHTVALDQVSLVVEPGERIVILGPSGCGKTTVLRLIAGFVAPDRGTVRVGGRAVSRDGRILVPPEKRRLGMVFQDLALWPHLTVRGNLEFGLKAQGVDGAEREARIRQTLDQVGLGSMARRKPAQLSGGQQQRVALARALVLRPRLLLMDEPLSSLDRDLNVRLRQEILRLHRKLGFSLLYVTHDRDEALDMATRVVVMAAGHVDFQGGVDQARARLKA